MAAPWERYSAPTTQGPWSRFAPPAEPEVKVDSLEQPSVAADIAGGLQGGVIRGAAALPGLPGSIVGLVQQGADTINRQTVGRAYNRFAPGGTGDWSADTRASQPMMADAISAVNVLPRSDATVKAIESIIGETYRPQTLPGKLAAGGAEFVGGGMSPAIGLLAGAASEGAGLLTHGTAAEPFARIGASIATPMAARRAITPIRADPARVPLTDALAEEGVQLTAGQRTGSKPLQWAESVLGDMPGAGGTASAIMERQGRQFTHAAARRMGEDAELLTPDVMAQASRRIGGQFNDLSARNTLQVDLPFTQDITRTAQEYRRVLPSQQRETFNNILDDIVTAARNGQGQIPGNVYQEARSRLTRIASGASTNDPTYAEAMRGLRRSLDDAMTRSISPADAEAWQAARTQYASMKTLEKAMAGAGEKSAQGYLSPQQLRTAVKGANAQAYVRGEGDLAELARAGAGAMQPLPNSGTTPRAFMQGLMTGGGAVGGGFEGAALGLLGPAIGGRVLMSRPVQAYLGNRVIQGGEGVAAPAYRGLLGYLGR